MDKRDFYEILGVAKDASAEEIKRAYRKAALQCHPDRHPGDKEAANKFRDVYEAYDVLRDDQKRKAYDQGGHEAFERGGPGAAFEFYDSDIRSFHEAMHLSQGTVLHGRKFYEAYLRQTPSEIVATANQARAANAYRQAPDAFIGKMLPFYIDLFNNGWHASPGEDDAKVADGWLTDFLKKKPGIARELRTKLDADKLKEFSKLSRALDEASPQRLSSGNDVRPKPARRRRRISDPSH